MQLLPLPQFCSLSLTKAVDGGAVLVPTLTTRFDHLDEDVAMAYESFEVITGLQAQMSECEERPGYITCTVTAVHDCDADACPSLFGRIAFDIPKAGVGEVLTQFDTQKSFLWICSTPLFEGYAYVSKPSSRIASKNVVMRDLH